MAIAMNIQHIQSLVLRKMYENISVYFTAKLFSKKPQIYSVKIEQGHFIEHASKAIGRVATEDCFVIKAVNHVRGKPQTSLTAMPTWT